MDADRTVAGDGIKDTGLHEIDYERRESGLDDMAANTDGDHLAVAVRRCDILDQRAHVARRENIGKPIPEVVEGHAGMLWHGKRIRAHLRRPLLQSGEAQFRGVEVRDETFFAHDYVRRPRFLNS